MRFMLLQTYGEVESDCAPMTAVWDAGRGLCVSAQKVPRFCSLALIEDDPALSPKWAAGAYFGASVRVTSGAPRCRQAAD